MYEVIDMYLLQALYRGEIRPDEENRPAFEELAAARDAYIRHREKLLRKMEASVHEEIEALLEEHMEIASFEMEDAYVRGMRMGAQLMVELLARKEPAGLA